MLDAPNVNPPQPEFLSFLGMRRILLFEIRIDFTRLGDD